MESRPGSDQHQAGARSSITVRRAVHRHLADPKEQRGHSGKNCTMMMNREGRAWSLCKKHHDGVHDAAVWPRRQPRHDMIMRRGLHTLVVRT